MVILSPAAGCLVKDLATSCTHFSAIQPFDNGLGSKQYHVLQRCEPEYFLESVRSYLTGWSSEDAQKQTSKMCNSWGFHRWENISHQSRFGAFLKNVFSLFIPSASCVLAEGIKAKCVSVSVWLAGTKREMFGLRNKDDGVHLSQKLRGNLSGSFVWQQNQIQWPQMTSWNAIWILVCKVKTTVPRVRKGNECFYFTAMTDAFPWLACVHWC